MTKRTAGHADRPSEAVHEFSDLYKSLATTSERRRTTLHQLALWGSLGALALFLVMLVLKG